MKDRLKLKVIAGFTLATLVVLLASYFTISNFLSLRDSVNELSLPDAKLIKINKVLTDISEAESIVRSYTLTNNRKYLRRYVQIAEVVKDELDTLKQLTRQNKGQYTKMDSITKLWSSKIAIFNNYIDLKSKIDSKDFSAKAIDKISQQAEKMDSITTTTTKKTTEIAEKVIVPEPKIEIDTIQEAPKKDPKGLLGLIKGIFTKKEEDTVVVDSSNTVEPKTYTKKSIKYDTVITQEDANAIIDKIVDILADLQQEESRFKTLMTAREFALLEKDVMIMEKIRTMIRDVQDEELMLSYQKTKNSKNIAQKSISTIFIIGLSGLLVSIVFIYLIINDITKSNFYKQKLERAKRRAERLAKAKEEFLANMSHEIRTPLSSIVGFTDQLSKTILKDKQLFYLNAVKNSSEHLLNTVNDILDFSKIEAGQLRLEKVPFKLSQLLRDVLGIFQIKAEEKDIEITLKNESDDQLILLSDPFRIKQILFNLIGNAIKFTNKGAVNVVVKQIDQSEEKVKLEIKVVDSGVGIPKSKLNNIFRGFQQADSSTTRRYGGTGLGLTISKRLVELLGGKISVVSKQGKGSIFTVIFDFELSKQPVHSEVIQQKSIDPSLLAGKKILVIDDDEYNILLFHTILKKWNMEVDIASNGKEGWSYLVSNQYDIVLTDINMPEMSGTTLVRKAKNNIPECKETPFLAITAHINSDPKNALIEDYVLKPFKEFELYLKICKALNIQPESELKTVTAGEAYEDGVTSEISLEDIRNFAEGDDAVVHSMVNDLLQNNRKSIFQINQAFEQNDIQKVRELAHKMQPSFSHIHAHPVVEILRVLETGATFDKNEVGQLISKLNHLAKEVFTTVEAKMLELKLDKV